MRKKAALMLVLFLAAGCIFTWNGQKAEAAEKKKVMTLSIQDAYKTTSTEIYAVPYGSSSYHFEMGQSLFYVLKKNDSDNLKVTVTVDDTSLIMPESLKYDNTVVLKTSALSESIRFQYDSGGDAVWITTLSYMIYPAQADLSVDSLALFISSKGFHPSKGNYLRFCSDLSANLNSFAQGSVKLRVRVNNKAGKYVFQKTYKNISGEELFDYKWTGKASKNNQAGVKAASYVKDGTYKLELTLIYSGNGYQKTAVKTKSFRVSRKAPSGKSGLADATLPMLTGNANIDYIAEQMIKKAGIRSSMSDDQKVKKIYHYMTVHFKHVHYSTSKSYKVYYNVTTLKNKINAYKKTTDAKQKKGKLVYTYQTGYDTEWCMARRIGVCDDHAMIFKILCNHEGIEAGVCGGYYLNRSGTKSPHAWNYAVVNGKTYYYDVDVEIQNYKKGQGDYYWYKKTKSQAKKTHQFN